MMPYSRGLILDSNNYGIVKTETVFGFRPSNEDETMKNLNASTPLEWLFTPGNFEKRSLQDTVGKAIRAKRTATTTTSKPQQRSKKKIKKKIMKNLKKKLKRKGKVKKCIFKVLNKGKKRKKKGLMKHKKYIMPMLIGLLAIKAFLITIGMKALAFLSTKGLMMGFFSTVMASVLSLKGMFDSSYHRYQDRRDDSKTQVEIIQVPTKSDDHVYYDEHYKKNDYIPMT